MDEVLNAKINQETSRIPWIELQAFFAKGVVVYVSEELDLVDVAAKFSQNDTRKVGTWMESGLVGKIPDDLAAGWVESDAQVWAVVVKPWVLVQPLCEAESNKPQGG